MSTHAERVEQLAELESRIVECRRCPRLVAWREEVAVTKRAAFADETYWGRPVPGFGDPDARVVVVGLAPAAHGANRTGRMFTGDRSGDFLYASMHRTGFASQPTAASRDDGLELSGAWVTSPVKCVPPQNSPTTTERDACAPFLARELEVLPWRVIVALGGFGFQVVARHFDVRPRPHFGHAVEIGLGHGRTLLGSYHVSQQNTFTRRLTPGMLDAVFERARTLAGR
ncbi:MAG TPA: uracil-DNA glycosylase [Acidimicrobiales bacterium]|nr:uracil-DNA glycosylase [Acidimicrobiales bacterium]